MKGRFITIEGCDGAGKSTQVRLLKEYCQSKGIEAIFTREPGGTPSAEKIRDIILYDDSGKINEYTETLLYAACRAQHVRELIIPAINKGELVFCDRFVDSTLAYQGYGRGIDLNTIKTLNSFATKGLTIDLTLFLNVHPKDAFLRKKGSDENDRIESMGLEFHTRVYEGFLSIKEQRFVKIDAYGSKLETHQKIIECLKENKIL